MHSGFGLRRDIEHMDAMQGRAADSVDVVLVARLNSGRARSELALFAATRSIFGRPNNHCSEAIDRRESFWNKMLQ